MFDIFVYFYGKILKEFEKSIEMMIVVCCILKIV